ncbi:hypothetical protein GCM10010306_098670 [Streptomyces umbrinus]|nr:hypothetical protein GCM10010306_098670 [Streptomyces umbrinus]
MMPADRADSQRPFAGARFREVLPLAPPADAGLQHAAAPGGYPVCRGDVVQAAGLQVAADAGGLDVHDPAGVLGDGGGGAAGVVQRLVQTDGVAMRRWRRALA